MKVYLNPWLHCHMTLNNRHQRVTTRIKRAYQMEPRMRVAGFVANDRQATITLEGGSV